MMPNHRENVGGAQSCIVCPLPLLNDSAMCIVEECAISASLERVSVLVMLVQSLLVMPVTQSQYPSDAESTWQP